MEPIVDCVFEDARWDTFGLDTMAEAAARAMLAGLGLPQSGYLIVVMGCDDARIATLNADFRGKPQATNVLSWPSQERALDSLGAMPAFPAPDADDATELGDIAIAWETCVREAAEQGKPHKDHVTHLLVHGMLHLLGYDHINDADATLMEQTEARILASLGVADPY
jgi:probable rRNA maturation factor